MKRAVLTSTGFYAPPHVISNDELIATYNAYAATQEGMEPSSSEFVVKASGIRQRHLYEPTGVLDVTRQRPRLQERPNSEPSLLCEFSQAAIQEAFERGKCGPEDIDSVIVSCSSLPRPYPALAIEIQNHLGIQGYGYDMNVACSSSTFAIHNAVNAVCSGAARAVLVVNPELTSGHLNFRDRDTHFIFGDACTAIIVQDAELCRSQEAFEILSTSVETKFSNNLRNNFGFLNRCEDSDPNHPDKLFVQKGRAVFKEVVPMAARHISTHLEKVGAPTPRCLWLHQANQNMNDLIAKMVLGREATPEEAPAVLGDYANTGTCGSIIAFHTTKERLSPGDFGIICSFGAGYSLGSLVVRKL